MFFYNLFEEVVQEEIANRKFDKLADIYYGN